MDICFCSAWRLKAPLQRVDGSGRLAQRLHIWSCGMLTAAIVLADAAEPRTEVLMHFLCCSKRQPLRDVRSLDHGPSPALASLACRFFFPSFFSSHIHMLFSLTTSIPNHIPLPQIFFRLFSCSSCFLSVFSPTVFFSSHFPFLSFFC